MLLGVSAAFLVTSVQAYMGTSLIEKCCDKKLMRFRRVFGVPF